MDRPIHRTSWARRHIVAIAGAGTVGLLLLYMTAFSFGKTRRDIDPQRLSVSQVTRGQFREYVPIEGSVQPGMSVFLDVEEGGIVQKIYVQGGSPVHQGDLIISLSNTGAQKQSIETETRLLENLDQLRNSKISLTQSSLILKDQLLDINYKIRDLEKTYTRYQELMKTPSSQLSKEQFESTSYQLTYYRNKRDLLEERIRRETELQQQQSKQIDKSIERVNRNLEVLTRIVDSLEVRAPIDGNLSLLGAEVGQNIQAGARIGQIDQLGRFKVRAGIDQYYIGKVAIGQRGRFEFAGKVHELEMTKIYPEVTEESFQVDMAFVGEAPDGLNRGQTLQIDLGLSAPTTTAIVEKGEFYRHTKGRWVYVLAQNGQSARRTDVVLGRQNPQYVEVLKGLEVGDRIINSSYDTFDGVDQINFAQPLDLKR